MSKPRKREGSPYWWYDFTVGGHRFRGSTETDCHETAKAIIARLRSQAVQEQHFDKKKEHITLDTACGKYMLEHGQYLKSFKTVKGHCDRILSHFGSNTYLHNIENKHLNTFVAMLRQKTNKTGERTLSDTTINRILETFRKIYHLAQTKWEVQTSTINFREHMLREPEARTRWITHEEAERLIHCAEDHLKPIIRFALLTGLRLSNITGLRWKDINLTHREMNFRIKSNIPGGKLLVLPISDQVAMLLCTLQERPVYKNRRRILDKNKKPVMMSVAADDYVFTYKGDPIKSNLKKSFKTACTAAKIEDFRFHDLRHTAASWMIQSGIPIDLVQEILGHTQITTTKKYAHRDQSEKLKAMQMISVERTGERAYG